MIVIAKVGAPYRLKGESKLYILSDSVETALAYGQWYIQRNQQQQWVKLQDEMVTRLGDKLLIQFDNVNTREEAGQYTNALIGVPREALTPTNDDEYYWADLIGLQVINKEKQSFGQVVDMIDTGANDVLICQLKDKQYLIPFINRYVVDVDQANKVIRVDWQYDY